jgi:hypothetical protein
LKEGVAEERDCYYFQEIGYSRKVAIARARELDMLVCRHAWEGEVVEKSRVKLPRGWACDLGMRLVEPEAVMILD